MSVTIENRRLTRERGGLLCEYCGVTEAGVGAELTIDHYQPPGEGGSDELGNLVYACHRCNEHKGAYWPKTPGDLPLYNPRRSAREEHFIQLMDGLLLPITPIGAWTILRLRLNRPALVENRLFRQAQAAQDRRMHQLQDIVRLAGELLEQERVARQEQAELLEEYRRLLRLLEPEG